MDSASVGEKIKKLRKSQKITQAEMGKALNLANTTIASWESGSKSLTAEKLYEVATIFNVPVSYFFDDESTYQSEQMHPTFSYLTVEQSVFFTDLMTKTLEMDIEKREKFIDSIKFAIEFFNRNND
ncbi:Transcriptional regulator, contains XRE-family HTH domain [Psychrobacillus sp. OK028]|uniref:helix-turn-helix domain-containing protein n=1 Tax=Psychrobacillus sp. OK028 TaxID=1884359 RepID=UPI0008847987|nr:helix-turn-helix transcriptional regulator [Psychrobacillus sp. OK028]SDN56319.1 Transcriptional regulator, contains XRE-family HTH domain [Psychrobacillus sp. OK028]